MLAPVRINVVSSPENFPNGQVTLGDGTIVEEVEAVDIQMRPGMVPRVYIALCPLSDNDKRLEITGNGEMRISMGENKFLLVNPELYDIVKKDDGREPVLKLVGSEEQVVFSDEEIKAICMTCGTTGMEQAAAHEAVKKVLEEIARRQADSTAPKETPSSDQQPESTSTKGE